MRGGGPPPRMRSGRPQRARRSRPAHAGRRRRICVAARTHGFPRCAPRCAACLRSGRSTGTLRGGPAPPLPAAIPGLGPSLPRLHHDPGLIGGGMSGLCGVNSCPPRGPAPPDRQTLRPIGATQPRRRSRWRRSPVTGGVLNAAYERFHRTGPEWGEDRLTNHGPMAAEVLVRRGHEEAVDRWIDAYIRRLDELPPVTGEITDSDWASALGDGRRVGAWTAYLIRQLAEQPWRQVLATWWARLLPGIAAGTTHGVIRTGHVVRALLAGAESPPTLDELAHALAFWAARAQSMPAAAAPAGRRDPLAALDALPRIPDQQGTVSARFGQLAELTDWPASVAG